MKVFINENINVHGNTLEQLGSEEFEKNIKNLLECLTCFNFFNESEIYFNSDGINNLAEDLKLIKNSNEYYLSDPISHLREFIKHSDAIDWYQNITQSKDHDYQVLHDEIEVYSAKGGSLAEATEYNYKGEKVVILNFIVSEFNNLNIVNVNRKELNPPNTTVLYKMISISNKKQTINYYLTNRDILNYHPSTKHGENHERIIKQGKKIISPLECTHNQAENFLKLSIGNKQSRNLFAYDQSKNKYIVFKEENTPDKAYHAFYPHDQKIPDNVKIFLRENHELFQDT